MLYQLVNTSKNGNCQTSKLEQTKFIVKWIQEINKRSGINVLEGHVSPLNHAYYVTIEAEDYRSLTAALGPLDKLGVEYIFKIVNSRRSIPATEDEPVLLAV